MPIFKIGLDILRQRRNKMTKTVLKWVILHSLIFVSIASALANPFTVLWFFYIGLSHWLLYDYWADRIDQAESV